ncbi:uncharacterized protein G2W53_044977 [Senna tora]|uniref:Uncharacterized protein n=1 Tax=Senna tora TaxID=362788 RepID=A0A834SCH4_9FABA|nr:uncharacterized protein G2W53_044977 [Senna tora]
MREMVDAMKRQVHAADRMLQHIQGDRDDRPQGDRARDALNTAMRNVIAPLDIKNYATKGQ